MIMRFAAVLVLMTAVSLSYGEVLFEDDFEEGLDKWEFTDSDAWEIVVNDGDNVLGLTGKSRYKPPVRSPRNIAWTKDFEADSFQLDVEMRQTGREYGHRDLCLFFGKQDASKFYYVHIASVADPHAHSIFLVNDEPRVSIVEERTEGADWGDEAHHIRLIRDVESGLIEVYFDDMDTPIMTTHDKTFGAGPIGLGSFDDVGEFDDVVVRSLDEE